VVIADYDSRRFDMAYMVKVSAPGRLNFLNTHQDYKGLPVVSIAVNLRAYLTAAEGRQVYSLV